MKDVFDLSGKTAVITGAAGLLGIQHAQALLDKNSEVLLTDINNKSLSQEAQKLAAKYPGKVHCSVMDVTKIESIKKVPQFLEDTNKTCDILINNAAVDPKVSQHSQLNENTRLENLNLLQWDMELSLV